MYFAAIPQSALMGAKKYDFEMIVLAIWSDVHLGFSGGFLPNILNLQNFFNLGWPLVCRWAR